MKKFIFAMLFVFLPASAWAQKTCTRVSSTSQNCIATVTWIASVVDAAHDAPSEYGVRRSDSTGAKAEIGKVSANITTFQNTFTDAGNTAHCWDVVARNSGGSAAPATEACWTTPAIQQTAPSTPGGLTLAQLDSSTLRFTWDSVINQSGYEVYGRPARGSNTFDLLASVPTDSTNYEWTGLKAHTSYCGRVRAVGGGGLNSAYTSTLCATTNR